MARVSVNFVKNGELGGKKMNLVCVCIKLWVGCLCVK